MRTTSSDLLSRSASLDFSQGDMPRVRRRMAGEILGNAFAQLWQNSTKLFAQKMYSMKEIKSIWNQSSIKIACFWLKFWTCLYWLLVFWMCFPGRSVCGFKQPISRAGTTTRHTCPVPSPVPQLPFSSWWKWREPILAFFIFHLTTGSEILEGIENGLMHFLAKSGVMDWMNGWITLRPLWLLEHLAY